MQPIRPRLLRRPVARAMALLFALVDLRPATADELAVDPSIQARSTVADNFLFQSGPVPTVLVLSLSPELSMSRTTENSTLKLDAAATKYTVPEEHSYDHTNASLALSYDLADETEKYSFAGSLRRDLTIDTELATNGVVLSDTTRTDLTASAGWTHSLSERLTTDLQFSFEDARYAAPTAGADLSNYHYYAAPLSVIYQVAEQDTLSLTLSTSLYHADEITDRSTTGQLQATWQHQFDERGTVSISAGEFKALTHTRGEITVCPINPVFCLLGYVPVLRLEQSNDSRQSGSIINLALQYQLDEHNSVAAHASRALSPSGLGSLLLVESIDTTIKHDFDETTSASMTYQRARSDPLGSGAGALANGYQSLVGSVLWKNSEHSSVELGLRRLATTHDQPGPSIHADEIYANFRYVWPDSAAARAN